MAPSDRATLVDTSELARRRLDARLVLPPWTCHVARMLSADAAAALDAQLDRWTGERDFSGTVLLTQAGSTVFERCYGLADRAAGIPITPKTRFGLASVTKLFTAVAIADCVSAGLLRFDDAVADLLPAERRPTTLRPDVTVHHLLTHTSGIADYSEEDEDSPRLPRGLRHAVRRPAELQHAAAGRLPAALRGSAAVPTSRPEMAVLERRVRRARPRHRGGVGAAVHGLRAGARLRPRRDELLRILPPG